MSGNAVYVFHEDTLKYRFNDAHPFNQQRLIVTRDLLRQAGALSDAQIARPLRAATEEELLYVHTADYVNAVKRLSAPTPSPEDVLMAERFGLNTDDTPFFENMHDITRTVVGGSIEAAERVMSGKCDHALHLGGGLHHAMRHKGSGFCVYNDASVAIAYIRRHYDARVLYIDTDVHHGDGVQWTFYTVPEVCTLSLHETGKYLFPGTGAVNERGEGDGFGYTFNLPLEPYTEDESWLDAFNEAVDKVTRFFRPDVIVSQHGCDAHAFDPLSHIHCSMRIYAEMPRVIHRLAHEFCGGKWIALGGGGYDIWRVVPRAWSLVWLAMTEHPLLDEIERNPDLPLPEAWKAAWAPQSPVQLPDTWLDPVDRWAPIPRRREISEKNRQTKELALLYLPK